MPTPVPEPTATQIVKVAEITMLSVDDVSTMIAADSDQDIVNAKWALTLADITAWDVGIRNATGKIKKVGSIEFFEGRIVETRLDFRNMIRVRYGKSVLFYEGQDEAQELVSTQQYF